MATAKATGESSEVHHLSSRSIMGHGNSSNKANGLQACSRMQEEIAVGDMRC
jgi:hypothetical protein